MSDYSKLDLPDNQKVTIINKALSKAMESGHEGILCLPVTLPFHLVDEHRSEECPHYEFCLELACHEESLCKEKWQSFSCFFCLDWLED
jgi:hypothetical protein